MSDTSHRGARPSGLGTVPSDRRVLELDDALRGVEVMAGTVPGLGLARDPARVYRQKANALGNQSPFARGMVVHALPYVNWYKVQVGGGNGWVAACAMDKVGGPVGPREVGMYRPADNVLLFRPFGTSHYYILGGIPPALDNGKVVSPDWVVQGSTTGLKREAAHKFPITGMYKSGGVIDWSANRPLDQTSLEKGWVTPTGLAITVDDFLIQLRATEECGLWLSLFDAWTRLAGRHLLIESAAHEEDAGEDEGEGRWFRGVAAYRWEALGLPEPGVAFTEEGDDKDVQYKGKRAKVDLKRGLEDVTPAYRYQEYAGYLGQGHMRAVVLPAPGAGPRRLADAAEPDEGLFRETIGLDGSYTMVGAKTLHFGHRVKIVVPRAAAPAASKLGDDAEAGGYKFASKFGSGPDHKVGDVLVTGEAKSVLRPAAALDLVAYDVNWKAVHPFHYHAADYRTAQESGQGRHFDRVQDTLALDPALYLLADPEPKKLRIDHRYGDVEFYQRESFLRFHDDGSVHLAGGGGEEIVLAGGRIRLSCPLGMEFLPGAELVAWAEQILIRAKGSIDLSSTDKDVRVKARNNLHMLAKDGGVLVETRSSGTRQQYRNKVGEAVRSSGIVLKAADAHVTALAGDIYLRTGDATLGAGDITLDAGRGTRRVQVYGRELNAYVGTEVSFNFGPLGEDSTVRRAYYFTEDTAVLDAAVFVRDKIVGYGDNAGIIVKGGVYATRSIATAGVVASKSGGEMGKVGTGFEAGVNAAAAGSATAARGARDAGKERHKVTIVDKYYADGQLGADQTIEDVAFSFRDPPGAATQYRADRVKLPEARWQQLARFGLATGGVPWEEDPVEYQGRDTYPWPGAAKLVDEDAFLRLKELTLFDPGAGTSVDRPGPYEQPAVAGWEPVTIDGQYTLIR